MTTLSLINRLKRHNVELQYVAKELIAQEQPIPTTSSLSGHLSILQDDLKQMGIQHVMDEENRVIIPAGYLGHAGAMKVMPYIFNTHRNSLATYSKPYEKMGKTCLEMNHNGTICELQIEPFTERDEHFDETCGAYAPLMKLMKLSLNDKAASDMAVIHGSKSLSI